MIVTYYAALHVARPTEAHIASGFSDSCNSFTCNESVWIVPGTVED
jgi:hypothetical protein